MKESEFIKFIEELKLSSSISKEEVKKFCLIKNTTPKELTVSLLDKCLNGLHDIRNKINKGEVLENEDWVNVSVPFSSIVNILMNGWYLEK